MNDQRMVTKRQPVIMELLVLALALNLVSAFTIATAQAGALGTADYISWQQREQRVDRIQSFLTQERVQAQLVALGVDPQAATARVAAMTPDELAALDQQIADLPAGGNALAVIGAVFVVLIILELVGVTNVFTNI